MLDKLALLLKRDAGADAVWVFGSAARDNLRDDSDIDLALRFSSDSTRRSWRENCVTHLGKLGLLAGRDVHVIDIHEADLLLRMQVFRNGRVLLDLNPADTRRLLETTLRDYHDTELYRSMHLQALRRHFELATGATNGR